MTNTSRDYRDIIAGGALILIGLGAALHAYGKLPTGTWSHMGPGRFPVTLGLMLAALGAFVAIPAFRRNGTSMSFDLRPFMIVSLAVLVFALMIRPFGLLPTVATMTVISTFADSRLGWIGTAILAALLSLFAYGIFIVGLGMPLRMFAWPF